MQVQRPPGFCDLSRHVVSDPSGQSARKIDQAVQIEAGLQTDLVAEIDQVFGANIAGRPWSEWTSAETTQGCVEAARAGVVGREHVDRPRPRVL